MHSALDVKREGEEEGEREGREDRGEGGRRKARVTDDCVPFYSLAGRVAISSLPATVLLHVQDFPQTDRMGKESQAQNPRGPGTHLSKAIQCNGEWWGLWQIRGHSSALASCRHVG